MSDILKRLPNETEDQCVWRIGQAKSSGLLGDMTWVDIAAFLNKEFREDETKYYDSSAYRKKYKNFADAYEGIFSKTHFTESRISELEEQTNELYKIKKQVQDQRRELRNLLTPEARFDNLTEKLIESANHLCEIKPLNFKDYIFDVGTSEAVITFADWHYGMTTNNIWNQYNTDICRQRVSEFSGGTCL